MSENKTKNVYDDNIPETDLPQGSGKNCHRGGSTAEPLPESTRPCKDGPGGE